MVGMELVLPYLRSQMRALLPLSLPSQSFLVVLLSRYVAHIAQVEGVSWRGRVGSKEQDRET